MSRLSKDTYTVYTNYGTIVSTNDAPGVGQKLALDFGSKVVNMNDGRIHGNIVLFIGQMVSLRKPLIA